MSEFIVIDVPNVAHRNWHAMRGMEANAVCYGVLRDLHILARHLECRNFVFCFDSDSSIRKQQFPTYKATRPQEHRSNINKQLRKLRDEILPDLGYENILDFAFAEADDIIGAICKQRRQGDILYLVSTDQDLYQLLLHGRVSIWNQASKKEITETYLREEYELDTEEWIVYKSIIGDKSDNIPGVPGVGSVTAIKWILGSLGADSTPGTKIQAFIDASKDKINQKLMTLPHPDLSIPCYDLKEYEVGRTLWDAIMTKYEHPQLLGKVP
jgi:DNA polymerase I